MKRELFEAQWLDILPLGNAEDRIVLLGGIVAGLGLTDSVEAGVHSKWITWGVTMSHAGEFRIEGSMSPTFATFDVMITQVVAAATYTTPYLLAVPLQNSGVVAVSRPYLRLRLRDTALANHAYLRFFAQAWG